MKADAAFEHFRNSLLNSRLGQGYIVVGPPKSAGVPLAERVLQLLRCEGTEKPCGVCAGCRRVASRSDPDFLWVEPQSKSRIITVEDIEAVCHRVYHSAYMGQWKACVLVGADRVGEVAANKFLKTLEEPPPRCLFFLLTECPEQLLPTIRSRCQTVQLQETAGQASAWSESLPELLMSSSGPPEEIPRFAAAFGRADRLNALLKQVKEEAEKLEKKAARDLDEDVDGDVVEARASARYREVRTSLMRTLLLWYRDLLLLVSGAGTDSLHFREHAAWLQAQAARVSYRTALRNCRIVERMYGQLEGNMPESAVLGWGFCRLS